MYELGERFLQSLADRLAMLPSPGPGVDRDQSWMSVVSMAPWALGAWVGIGVVCRVSGILSMAQVGGLIWVRITAESSPMDVERPARSLERR